MTIGCDIWNQLRMRVRGYRDFPRTGRVRLIMGSARCVKCALTGGGTYLTLYYHTTRFYAWVFIPKRGSSRTIYETIRIKILHNFVSIFFCKTTYKYDLNQTILEKKNETHAIFIYILSFQIFHSYFNKCRKCV